MKHNFELLAKANINQREAAALLGVTPTTISLWTNNHRNPSHLIEDKLTALLADIEAGLKDGSLPIPDWRNHRARWKAIQEWRNKASTK